MKEEILKLVITEAQKRLDALVQSAFDAHDAATNSESKAENKYDTRGLEASYLAGAQSKRAEKLKEALFHLKKLKKEDLLKTNIVGLCSLVVLRDEDKIEKSFYVLPAQGGTSVEYEGIKYQVITLSSPMGAALYNKQVGDEIEIIIGKDKNYFEVIQVQ